MLFVSAQFHNHEVPTNHSNEANKKRIRHRLQVQELQKKAELYYQNQMRERTKRMQNDFPHINANYPCIEGTEPLGLTNDFSVLDDHKFGCGISKIIGPPIVYSFGSNKVQNFETGFLELRPDANIYIFEINKDSLVDPTHRLKGIQYFNIGLGYNSENLRSLKQLMINLNHSYIDVLKMDIEGDEWRFAEEEPQLLANIGQLLIEVHVHPTKVPQSKGMSPLRILEIFERQNMRLFFKEGNFRYGPDCCSEWSLIQRDWRSWEDAKHSFKILS